MSIKMSSQQATVSSGLYEEEEEEKPSSLQKTIGNVVHLLSDGLYRMKNRNKSE